MLSLIVICTVLVLALVFIPYVISVVASYLLVYKALKVDEIVNVENKELADELKNDYEKIFTIIGIVIGITVVSLMTWI